MKTDPVRLFSDETIEKIPPRELNRLRAAYYEAGKEHNCPTLDLSEPTDPDDLEHLRGLYAERDEDHRRRHAGETPTKAGLQREVTRRRNDPTFDAEAPRLWPRLSMQQKLICGVFGLIYLCYNVPLLVWVMLTRTAAGGYILAALTFALCTVAGILLIQWVNR